MNQAFQILQELIATPNLTSKNWISRQYDSQVQNNTIATGGDAAIVRINNSKKAVALTTDCNPRYVEADPYLGAIQAVAETYRNISATGAKPLAITNCLNFGNPQKPEIMGQIVKSIQGITKACIELDYPVVSGNVSLYNETNGKAIQPTPAIGGVGLLQDYTTHCYYKFTKLDQLIYVVGNSNAHTDCSLYQQYILKQKGKIPPLTNLELEKKHSLFVRNLISQQLIQACHDVSCGGLLVALFEMCTETFGCKLDFSTIINGNDIVSILFGEDQSRYIVAISAEKQQAFLQQAKLANVNIFQVGNVVANNFCYQDQFISTKYLQQINQQTFPSYF